MGTAGEPCVVPVPLAITSTCRVLSMDRQFGEKGLTEQRVTIDRHDARYDVSNYVIAHPHLVKDILLAVAFGTVRQHRCSRPNKVCARDSAGSGQCAEHVSGQYNKGGTSIQHERQCQSAVYLNGNYVGTVSALKWYCFRGCRER